MKHLYEEIDEHIQWLINFMNEEYPNNYELVIDSKSGTIRSTLQAQMFLRKDMQNPEGVNTTTKKSMNELVEKITEVAKKQYENPGNVLGHAIIENREDGVYAYGFFNDNSLCECWDSCVYPAVCNGTKERDACHCGGDVKKCDFYPEKRGDVE